MINKILNLKFIIKSFICEINIMNVSLYIQLVIVIITYIYSL